MAKYMIVDGLRAEFTDEKNILQVIRNVGIHIPTFCYYTDLSIYGACRMCVVEDDKGNIIASCSTPPKDKMVIRTNTPKLHHHRKMILELLLASHCRDCTICEKNQKCQLQALARRFGLYDIRFKNNRPNYEIDDSSPAIVRDMNKCILCGDCVRSVQQSVPQAPSPLKKPRERSGTPCSIPPNGSSPRWPRPSGWPSARSSAWLPVKTAFIRSTPPFI